MECWGGMLEEQAGYLEFGAPITEDSSGVLHNNRRRVLEEQRWKSTETAHAFRPTREKVDDCCRLSVVCFRWGQLIGRSGN